MNKQINGFIMLFLGASLLPNAGSFLYSWALNGSDFELNWIVWVTLSWTVLLLVFGVLTLLGKSFVLINLIILIGTGVFQGWMLWHNQIGSWIESGKLGIIDYSRIVSLVVIIIGIMCLFIKWKPRAVSIDTDWQKKWRLTGVFFALLGLGTSITLAIIVLSGNEFFLTTAFDAYLGIAIGIFFLLAIVIGWKRPNTFITAPLLGMSVNFLTEYLWLDKLLKEIGSQIGSQIGQEEVTIVALKLIIGTLGIFASLFLIIASKKRSLNSNQD
ncbi:hypothetical protein PWEIH_01280 [Listeria weihenstephanensis FSL R9-0317]|uniref:Uncharacterized protein n=1 Tax=Listeria weihenstephanensis TaxID=1006155 RepID=A0A1S7FWG7_9LIST|nr:hypothetical protein [Listeria weihenstephanensis]AQY51730.1 hypothetical protein UE46_12250 [Listeria weihenstephanensis]EUJ41256.1 hypothetical protein PWEIH_01280 [Listeria weihenstephanensis FSL R9-0317]